MTDPIRLHENPPLPQSSQDLSLAIPEILPLVQHCAENISKPEARQMAERAHKTILDHYGAYLVLCVCVGQSTSRA